MTNQRFKSSTLPKFMLFSALGIFIFFINVTFNGATKVPLLQIIDNTKAIITKPIIQKIVMLVCLSSLGTSLWAKAPNAPAGVKEHHKKDNWFSYFTYVTAAVFAVMVVFNVGPEFIVNPKIGVTSVNLAGDVVFASTIAGALVVFLTEFGLLEFLGRLLEPIMRVCFKLPGKAAIDALSSFVCAPAVGVMITNTLYKKKIYTDREACAITTSFSIASLGAFAFLSGMAGCSEYYGQLIISSLILVFIMAAIMIRIPPISRKKNTFIDGTVQTDEERKVEGYSAKTFKEASALAMEKAETARISSLAIGLWSSLKFAQKIAAYVVSLSVIFLALANYTPIVAWLGVPMIPILNMLGLPDAAIIAPSTLAGFFALSLPSALLINTGVSAMGGFFIVLLSTAQIIFFTESANAMLDADIPVNFVDLLVIFLERTFFLIPLCALVTHLIF